MNIKFCYKDEIHKTFFPPATFKSLLEEIKTSFGDRMPSNFILQYKDKDGDLITMSSDLEYSSMLRFDTPRTRTSFKVFIVPVEEKEASFELVEASQSFSEDCMREFSLSSNSERKLSRSPSERNIDSPQKSTSRCSRPKSLSFSDCDGEEGSELMSPELELPANLSNELSQLYKAREMIIQEYLSNSPSKTSNSRRTRKTVKVLENANLLAHEDQDIYPSDGLDDSLALKEIDKFMAELAIKKEKAKLLSLPKAEVQQYKTEKYCLQKNDIQVCPTECYVSNISSNVESLILHKQNYTDYRETTSSYYTPYQTFEGTKSNEIQLIPFQMYSYETIVGLSSSILFLEDNEGHGTAYKTVYLKNTGMKPWKKCFVKPVGVLPGKTVEISNVEVGSIALVTLEVSGCFNVGIYDSQWRLVHENDYGVVETIGEPFNVNFIIDEANIMAAKGDAKSSKCDSFSEDKAKSSTEGTFREDSEEDELEDEDQEEGNGSNGEENMYGVGGPYSKEYLEYRDQITNKAKELKKIFPDDTPDEIIKFVMEKPELNFEDLLVAYLAMKDGATDY